MPRKKQFYCNAGLHPMSGQNEILGLDGDRRCRACKNQYESGRRAMKRHGKVRCARCTNPLVKPEVLKSYRHKWASIQWRTHRGRGLCASCYETARVAGVLDDYERSKRDPLDVIEDTLVLSQRFSGAERIASELGITWETLRGILLRNGKKNLWDSLDKKGLRVRVK